MGKNDQKGSQLEPVQKVASAVLAYLFLVAGNILLRLVYHLPFVKKGRKRFEKEVRPVVQFKSFWSFWGMGAAFSLIALLFTNYFVTVLRACFLYIYLSLKTIRDADVHVEFDFSSLLIQNLFNISVFRVAPIIAIPVFLIGLVLAWKSAWVNFEQYRDYNFNEEGDDRFATIKEVHRQYKKVPNKSDSYPGSGGVPVLHEVKNNLGGWTLGAQMLWQNRKLSGLIRRAIPLVGLDKKASGSYYIEDGTTNMLGIGMTRSGKGEGHITPTIELNSRAEDQPSMVISDPKGEHYQSSYKTLRKRGYDVEVLSFQNMDWSMSYNPLALAIAAAKKGYYEKTQTRVNAVAEAIYRKTKPETGNGNAKYWEDTSISLFNAITMALIDRAAEAYANGEKDAWDTVTIRNIAKFLTDLGSETVFVNVDGEVVEDPDPDDRLWKKSKITVYFDNLRKINQQEFSKFRDMADLNFRSSDFASEETKGNVFSSMMSSLTLFLQDNIAKLTSKNSIDLESVGFPRRMSIRLRSSSNRALENDFAHATARISIYSQSPGLGSRKRKYFVQGATALVDAEGYLNYAIEPKLPNQFTVSIDFEHENNQVGLRDRMVQFSAEKVFKRNGNVLELDPYTKKPILESIVIKSLNQEDQGLLQESDIEFIYSDSPKVIFLVTPPNRSEYNSLISLFLDQLFNANYEMALSNGRSCINRILHVLDEFTNIPAIPNMDTKISINLGQNILYYLWIQNLEQLVDKYGENTAKTIQDNCSLQIYVKSTSDKTNERFSKALGSKTITRRRRSSNILDEANPNVSIDSMRQDLLTPTQLAKLQEGEAVILRGVKGRDRAGRKVTTDPIFLHDKTSFPYAYMFLQDEFDRDQALADIPVESKHRNLNLQDVALAASSTFINLIDWRQALENYGQRGGEKPQLATRRNPLNQIQDRQHASEGELLAAAVASVFEDESLFVDDVI
ncbi:TraM recognition domain-containing protein [Streptococcus danieliae]|uniref:TraM recognition domain-containing protein n=1 Tax=Streptococcus danieliae TaxID=747656 RepID=A0A7X3KCU8_9STRE|nr:type IV secretory system conjugative DNA transfer family protein [Streptococcus danieliae]MVX58958.1 TraM recognition domain-containing protein [Streptococcus danieliae]